LDINPYLIGFDNGVYDLNTHTFRDGKYDDYITMSTRYNYRDKYSIKYKKLITFLEDILPLKEDREYLLTYISTALFGNTLELFTVLVGNGRNGKSKFMELLTKVFGDYFEMIGSGLLTTQIKEGDAPAPALLNLINKKLVMASETSDNLKLNAGFIKFITGRDSAKYRYCHQNDMIKFSPNFITMLVCNNIPECDNIDNAFSKRLRCINFPTDFIDVSEINPKKTNQKIKDTMINTYFDDWKQDFFLLLLKYYKIMKKINIYIQQKIF
jgi:phage/plasmid-associated DNA primase